MDAKDIALANAAAERDALRRMLWELELRLEAWEKALRFYGDGHRYDAGERAREALSLLD